MPTNNDYIMYEQPDGTWDVEKQNAKRALKKGLSFTDAKKMLQTIIENSGNAGRIFYRHKNGKYEGEDIPQKS